jgi:hypothetical protein
VTRGLDECVLAGRADGIDPTVVPKPWLQHDLEDGDEAQQQQRADIDSHAPSQRFDGPSPSPGLRGGRGRM